MAVNPAKPEERPLAPDASSDDRPETIEERLLSALAASRTEGVLVAGLAQLQALYDAEHARGTTHETLAPSRLVLSALNARRRGIHDPLLDPVDTDRLYQLPPREWEARACLAMAYKYRLKMGEPKQDALRTVVGDFGDKSVLPDSATLAQWCRYFGRPPGARAPREGSHWEILSISRGQLASIENKRSVLLAADYATLIRLAHLMVRQPTGTSHLV